MFDSLAAYPHWLVVTCAVLAGVALLWVLLKLLKAAMYLLFFGLVAATVVTAVWYFFP
ncbi:MAG TPA: hypothetical protein VII09_09485 [Opitutaceae bacterium]